VLGGEVGGVLDLLPFAGGWIDVGVEIDAQLLGQVGHRIDEGLPQEPLGKGDGVTPGLAAEALEALLLGPDVEGGGLLLVKRAATPVASAGLLELDPVALDQR